MEQIPMLDLKSEIEFLWDDLMKAIEGVLKSGQFIMGPNVKAFEEEVAAYLGVKHAIGVNSGTDALTIALRAAGVGPGDEVITTPFTFFATAEAISHAGGHPVFVDIDPETFNLDPNQIEPAITPKTKAIIPVHLYGHAADMDPILEIAKVYKLRVVEDVAQAFGGEYKGRKLGSLGDAGCFSFFPSKNLGAYGDGGLIATNDDELAETARMLRVHGAKRKYYNEVIGYNSRLDEIQAASLRVKLPYVDRWNEMRREIARRYNNNLSDVSNIVLPIECPYAKHVYHQYTIRISGVDRETVRAKLAESGIQTAVYYPVPLHLSKVYRTGGSDHISVLPHVDKVSREVVSLPLSQFLRIDVVDNITETLRALI
ncbi:DegT/DnrJ/EryC1/StrS family aminotransferase [Kyrpidia sp.]|uniref:DegT/DnrJ/EryC1/StrS family aminotransferase n=1 Tax=Kyrpidia sp. TaxID=2073077 RepID=UPI00258F350C|nr:DegT/DnrJ/EryC1/StrS family aminotransferase [Kyrpidia sp.]MCL6576113.1 DegT/DnrJ/EryC1/StrS family aminotransferase [Kyrpidia sp.]